MRRIFFPADADGVPRIGPAAISNDNVGFLRDEIDDLPLPFIAPLQPENAGVSLKQRQHDGWPFAVKTRDRRKLRAVNMPVKKSDPARFMLTFL
jgi:hypothetical protein